VGVAGDGADLAIVTYGNGRYLAEQAAADLRASGIRLRLIDLRWLVPLPVDALVGAVSGCSAVLVVDECRRSGNVSEGVMTALAEAGQTRAARLTATDSLIATGPAHAATLPSADGIVAAARALLQCRDYLGGLGDV
jgi:2-oxoisovalerate dehydrogenase E1 component